MNKPDRRKSILILALIYAGAILAAILAGSWWSSDNLLLETFLLDFMATFIIFFFSVIFNNSSAYDPYWRAAPPIIVIFWMIASGGNPLTFRNVLILFLFLFWSSTLPLNFLRRWQGFKHEDWRYEDIRKKTGRYFWIVSFLGIHLFPTIIVFLACIPAYFAITQSSNPVNILDLLAFIVTFSAILIEMIADHQLQKFQASGDSKGKTLQQGLWKLVRHPNYAGQVLFWWGIYLFVIAAAPGYWWTIFGPLIMTLLFLGVSIPLMDEHMLKRRDDYSDYKKRTPALFPAIPKKHNQE